MSRLPLRVVKVGCSLFERRELAEQLRTWLRDQPPGIHLFLAGAGELADSIKTWDARFQIGEANSHWLCIRALSITARILSQVLDCPLFEQWSELGGWIAAQQQAALAAIDPELFLREVETTAASEPLPHTWEVTTDSIAARIAEVLCAEQLILLKARSIPAAADDFAALADAGYVDEHFPHIAPRVRRVTFHTLR